MSEEYNWLVEELWGSFGYNSPEEHAHIILKYISDKFIDEILVDLNFIMECVKEGSMSCVQIRTSGLIDKYEAMKIE